MTTFERFERDIPALMDEIAPPRLPDYLDDMLRQTGRTRQRPAWASLERWLPMDVVARPVPVRAPALRPLLVLLLIGLIVAAGLALYVGSQQNRLPEPFGPARNGILIGNVGEDIVAFDPATGVSTPLITGATRDIGPGLSRDGRQFVFVRLVTDDTGAFWISNVDGSEARELVPAPVDWIEWSAAGDRVVVSRIENALKQLSIVDVDDGTSSPLFAAANLINPYWRPGHEQILYRIYRGGAFGEYWLINTDGSDRHEVAGMAPNATGDAQFSPDGSKLAYSTWGTGAGPSERIHVLEIDTGTDTLATPNLDDGFIWQGAKFSPDGARLLVKRYTPGTDSYQLAIINADGTGEPVAIGPVQSGDPETDWQFSPDGTQVLAWYDGDGLWLLNADGSGDEQLDFPTDGGPTWQRLAP